MSEKTKIPPNITPALAESCYTCKFFDRKYTCKKYNYDLRREKFGDDSICDSYKIKSFSD